MGFKEGGIRVEEFSVKFLNHEGNPITRETVSELVHSIQKIAVVPLA